MKKILWVLAAAAVLFGVSFLLTRPAFVDSPGRSPATPSVSGRSQAADFHLTDLYSKPVSLSTSRGKVVILDFWATWCPPCREEIPHFKELYAQYKSRGLEIIGLSMDQGGVGVVKSFVANYGVSYPVALATPQVVEAYGGIRGIPTTFVIDKQGGIAKKYVGYQPKEVFEQDIRKLLAE